MRPLWFPGTLLIPLVFVLLDAPGQPPPVVKQATYVAPASQRRDSSKLPELAQPIFYSAASAAEWLKRTNKPDGRFVYGFQPSLRVQIEGDNFLSQAGATFALSAACHAASRGRR